MSIDPIPRSYYAESKDSALFLLGKHTVEHSANVILSNDDNEEIVNAPKVPKANS